MAGPSNDERIAAERLSRFCRLYVRAACIYLGLGLVLGALMLAFGNDNLQFVHGHVLLVGFVLFFLYALGYGLLPRALGAPPGAVPIGLATAQFYLANLGLLGMIVGGVLPVGFGLDRVAVLFGFIEAAAGILFAVALGKAIRGAAAGRTGAPV